MDAKKKEYGPFNHDLINAVRWLKKQDIIEWDKEIAIKTNYSKGTVSAYINGHIEASADFRTEFERQFELSLMDFQTQKDNTVNYPTKGNDHNKYVILLEETKEANKKVIERQEADLNALRTAINEIKSVNARIGVVESTVSDLRDKAEVAESNIEVLREWLIDEFSKLKKDSPQSVAASMGRKRAELLKKDQRKSTHVR